MSSLFARYKEWVRRNNSLLSVWETGLSSLTWLLPDRFSESEISLEAIHTAINLVSTFHDTIINESPGGKAAQGTELVFLLGALQQVQVLVELGAISLERQGRGNRYDALAAVEGLKALLRMLILYRSNSRILTNGGLTNFEQWAARGGLGEGQSPEAKAHQVMDAFAQFRSLHCKLGAAGAEEQEQEQQQQGAGGSGEAPQGGCPAAQATLQSFWWHVSTAARQEGKANHAVGHLATAPAPSGGLSASAAGGGASPEAAARAVQAWADGRQTLAMRMIITAELLHILRPLIYTMALRRWGRPSWRPWLASLAADVLSWQLSSGGAALSHSTAQRAAASPALKGSSAALLLSLQGLRWSSDERDELTRRKLLLVYYLLRDPLFCRYTGPAVRRWQGLVGRVPLAGWATDKLAEILVGMQQYYSYTAAS